MQVQRARDVFLEVDGLFGQFEWTLQVPKGLVFVSHFALPSVGFELQPSESESPRVRGVCERCVRAAASGARMVGASVWVGGWAAAQYGGITRGQSAVIKN